MDKNMVIDPEQLRLEIDCLINEKHIYDLIRVMVEYPTCLYENRNSVFQCEIIEKHVQMLTVHGFQVDIYRHAPSDRRYRNFYSVKIVKL